MVVFRRHGGAVWPLSVGQDDVAQVVVLDFAICIIGLENFYWFRHFETRTARNRRNKYSGK